MSTLSYSTLPSNDNINPYAFSLDVKGEIFIRKGKMIAYYGNLRFESLGSGMFDLLVRSSFSAPGSARDYVIVTGHGKLILGDYGRDLNSFDLENGNLTVRKDNVIAFDSSLLCQESVTSGFLALLGTGRFVASANGPVHFLDAPVRVDPEALLGWADLPCPSYHYDFQQVRSALQMAGTFLGLNVSGEEKQLDFTGKGTVIVQSSEEPVGDDTLSQRILTMLPGLQTGELTHLQNEIGRRLRGND